MRERRLVPSQLRNVSFPVAVRGYERHAVDTYVTRVNRVIAELEATQSPEAAIRHALHRVEEQTHRTLEEARERADELTAAAHRRAEDILARAKAEAADIVVNAETQADRATFAADAHAAEVKAQADAHAAEVKAEADDYVAKARAEAEDILARARTEAEESLRLSREEVASVRVKAEAWAIEFSADSEAIRKERSELLDDVRELALRLATAADDATARLPTEDLDARSKQAG